jgi:hypothetical protein
MKRIIIICEGATEVEFCKDILYPYFIEKRTHLQPVLIKKSGGGIIPWPALKKQILTHLLQDKMAYVTTFIDYYGIPARFGFPEWESAHRIPDKNQRMDFLEEAMLRSLEDAIRYRFLPYLQLHEFEGILFNDMRVFTSQIDDTEFTDKVELARVINEYPNSELINDTPDNAPSKRLKRLIRGYNKVIYGAILAREIGLEKIKAKNPRFNSWIDKLLGIT